MFVFFCSGNSGLNKCDLLTLRAWFCFLFPPVKWNCCRLEVDLCYFLLWLNGESLLLKCVRLFLICEKLYGFSVLRLIFKLLHWTGCQRKSDLLSHNSCSLNVVFICSLCIHSKLITYWCFLSGISEIRGRLWSLLHGIVSLGYRKGDSVLLFDRNHA